MATVWRVDTDSSLLSGMQFVKDENGRQKRPASFPDMFTGEHLSGTWERPRLEFWPKAPAQDENGNWVDLRGRPTEPVINVTDFPHHYGGVFLCSARAAEVVLPLLKDDVEVLPVEVVGHDYVLLNPVTVLDCLDEARAEIRVTRLRNGKESRRVERYAFDPNKVGSARLFKTPYSGFDVFAADAFKSVVEEHGLSGLAFRPAEATPRPVFRNGLFDIEYR